MKRHSWEKSGDHKVIEIARTPGRIKEILLFFLPVGQSSHGKILHCEGLA